MQRLLTGKTRLNGFTQPWKEVKLGEVLFEHSQKVVKMKQFALYLSIKELLIK